METSKIKTPIHLPQFLGGNNSKKDYVFFFDTHAMVEKKGLLICTMNVKQRNTIGEQRIGN